MSLAVTRWMVALTGLVVALVIALALGLVGGPDSGRRDRRDATRLSDLRTIAEALACHAAAKAQPDVPAALAEISPACLAADRVRTLADPASGDLYRIERPSADLVNVCGDFESAARVAARAPGWPPFDPGTGCVSATITPG